MGSRKHKLGNKNPVCALFFLKNQLRLKSPTGMVPQRGRRAASHLSKKFGVTIEIPYDSRKRPTAPRATCQKNSASLLKSLMVPREGSVLRTIFHSPETLLKSPMFPQRGHRSASHLAKKFGITIEIPYGSAGINRLFNGGR